MLLGRVSLHLSRSVSQPCTYRHLYRQMLVVYMDDIVVGYIMHADDIGVGSGIKEYARYVSWPDAVKGES